MIQIESKNYFGFIRGLETLAQLVSKEEKKILEVPILITDSPDFMHRGIMLDSARHFLKIETIKR